MLAKTKRPARMTTSFQEFAPYENGRVRNLKFDVNALADFEQEMGMGFATLMKQRAVFGCARAMLWAGLKHEDRGLQINDVGELLSDYLRDEDVPKGDHSIDSILMVAMAAAIEQGALGRYDTEEPVTSDEAPVVGGPDPNASAPSEVPEPEACPEPGSST
jgi:hypothetical protein